MPLDLTYDYTAIAVYPSWDVPSTPLPKCTSEATSGCLSDTALGTVTRGDEPGVAALAHISSLQAGHAAWISSHILKLPYRMLGRHLAPWL